MKTIKKNFTILEVLIALILSSIIISFLFKTFSTMAIFDKKIEEEKDFHIEKHLFYSQLSYLFDNIRLPLKQTKNGIQFFIYNGADPEKGFAGKIKAALFLQKKSLFCELESQNGKKRNECLIKKTKGVNFFFHKKDGTIQKKWENEELPCAIEIEVLQDKEKWRFIFPNQQLPIIFYR